MIKVFANFFTGMKIKYADHPFVFIPPFLFLVLALPVYFIFGISALVIILTLAVLVVFGGIFHAYRAVQESVIDNQRQTQALISLHQQLDFKFPLPAIYGWAAKPELLSLVQTQIAIKKPKLILELGSGVSTIVCGYACKKNGLGKVISLDHDNEYRKKTDSLLQLHEVDEFAETKAAPLENKEIGGKNFLWYNLSNLDPNLKFDMLIVDGPPQSVNKMARYPAVELIYERLNPGAVIILDDANREDEQKSFRKWINDYDDLEINTLYNIPESVLLEKKSTEIRTNGMAKSSAKLEKDRLKL